MSRPWHKYSNQSGGRGPRRNAPVQDESSQSDDINLAIDEPVDGSGILHIQIMYDRQSREIAERLALLLPKFIGRGDGWFRAEAITVPMVDDDGVMVDSSQECVLVRLKPSIPGTDTGAAGSIVQSAIQQVKRSLGR